MDPAIASMPPSLTRDSIRAAAMFWYGVREGDPRLPIATASKPWCAAWASQVIREAGGECPLLWSAAGLVDWLCKHGHALGPECSLYREADVVLFDRRNARGELVGHHVAFVLDDDGRTLTLISGNTHAFPGGPTDCIAIGHRARADVVRAARVAP